MEMYYFVVAPVLVLIFTMLFIDTVYSVLDAAFGRVVDTIEAFINTLFGR